MVVVVFVAGGVILWIAGSGAVGFGLFFPHLIADRLPPEVLIDTAAVGGASVALGVGFAIAGVGHLVTAAALRRSAHLAETAGVVLGASMAVLAFGLAVALLVSVVAATAPTIVLLPPAIVMGFAAAAYAATTAAILRRRRPPI